MHNVVASPTDNTLCCCDKEIQEYRGFTITWNITLVSQTVVADCKGDGIKGKFKMKVCFIDYYISGNVTRTCGLNNEWLPAKVYCIREQISMVLTEVGLTCSFKRYW